ncbi:MAG: hypothetical protein M1832_005886 [Thelocarpon impressellum]|nr:MAG: hypothetical protein M1832_005886 [Thelocarpon impressellum]
MVSDVQQTPFVKQLAANDRPTRDKAVASLRTYLGGRRTLTELELLKLWKGLFFCMWMSDRPRTQQRLAADLASLVAILPRENTTPFLQAFWTTMAREWNGIDVLRMDKFLHLTRAYLSASFQHLTTLSWAPSSVQSHLEILSNTPLHPTDAKIPNGLRYHVLDIYVDELDKADTPRGVGGVVPLDEVLAPLRTLRAESVVKSVRLRAADALGDERLARWHAAPDEDEVGTGDEGGEEEGEWGGIEDP